MADNFLDNIGLGASTLSVSADAISFGAGGAGAKSIIFNNSNSAGYLIWQPNANATISLPVAGGTVLVSGAAPGAVAAGTQTAISGTIVFSNSNNISFGMTNSSIVTASYNFNWSAGTTSNNLNSISFSNGSGVSFGLNAGTMTASVVAQTNQTIGLYAVSNTTQNSSTTLDARTLSFQGAGGVSVGYSNGSVVISGGAGAANVNISAGTTSNNLTAFVFSNSNNVSFGLNGSTVTATITVPAQTNQTVGLYALGNTTQNSSTTLDARTLSFNGLGAASVGYSNGSIQVSVPVQTAQTQSNIQAIYDGANSISTGTIRFTNANGVSFSINGQTISGSVAVQTNQTIGLYALGNTTQNSSTTLDARTLSFNGLGAASVGYSNGSIQISVPNALTNVNISAGTTSNNLTAFVFSNSNNVSFGLNGSTVTATITVPAQTVQTIGLYALGNTTQNSSTTLDARTLSFNGLGAATVGYSNGSIQVSVPVQTVQTQSLIQAIYDGANSISTGTIRFTNANGVSFSINGQTLSASIAAQSNQTEGFYAIGNTVGQSSSSTFDARTFSISGAGIASVGYSGNAFIISVPAAGASINFSAGTTSNNLNAITFSNSNNISFGLNGSTITASVSRPQVAQIIYPENPWQTNFQISNASFSLQHFNANADILASQANLLMVLSGNTNSSGALTISLGIYTKNGSTLSLMSSNSRQITWTSGSQTTASSLYGGISGTRFRTVSLANWSITAGEYVLGMHFRTTNNGTWNAFGQQGPTIVGAVDANETNHYLHGFSTSSYVSAMVASLNVTDTNFVRTGGNAWQQPGIILLGSF